MLMREGYRVWKIRVARWRAQFAESPQRGKYDPGQTKLTNRCAKCGNTKRLTRHHKGHEYFFACILPEIYAERYIRFVPSDCVVLCIGGKRCHQRVHNLYKKIMDEAWAYVQTCLKEVQYDNVGIAQFTWNHKPDFAVLESFRLRLVSRCDRWLERKNLKYNPEKYPHR